MCASRMCDQNTYNDDAVCQERVSVLNSENIQQKIKINNKII